MNLSQPTVLKYLLTTLLSNKSFQKWFYLLSYVQLQRRIQNSVKHIRFGFYLLTTCENDSSIRHRSKSFILFVFLSNCYKIGQTYIKTPSKCLSSFNVLRNLRDPINTSAPINTSNLFTPKR